MIKNQKLEEIKVNKIAVHLILIFLTSLIYGFLYFLKFNQNVGKSIVIFAITLFLFEILLVFFNIFSKQTLNTYRIILTLCIVGIINTAVILFFSRQYFAYYVPLLFSSLFLGIVGGNAVGIGWIFMQSSISTLMLAGDKNISLEIEIISSMIPASIFCVIKSQVIRKRTDLLRYGFLGGLISVIFIFLLMTIKNRVEIGKIDLDNLRNLLDVFIGIVINGVCSGFILTGLLPVMEEMYDLLTDLRLMELADLNHELLKKLSTEAPGTFHHSMNVARLAESAAEAIHCNPLVVRVGAYFHDIGKLTKPDYFKENEFANRSKHTNLPHSMSKLIIISHVKDGIDLAKEYKLPKWVIDFIPTHHGASLVEYFYREAIAKTPEEEGIKITGESFRYPGPKPRTKEEGILMLADSIEAATRNLDEYSPAKIMGAVHEIIVRKLLDGQLSKCSLTMGELEKIENTFVEVIAAIYHSRIKYPEEKKDTSTKRIYKSVVDEKKSQS